MAKNSLRKKLRRKMNESVLGSIENCRSHLIELYAVYSQGSDSSNEIASHLTALGVMLDMVEEEANKIYNKM